MNLVAPPRRFDPNCPEMLDRPGTDPNLLREELNMLETMNRRFGIHRLIVHQIERLLRSNHCPSWTILDLATGSADIPRALTAWFRKHHTPVAITAVDGNPVVLSFARESCKDWPEIRLEQHDLLSLPYETGSYDLVICSLALHHFGFEQAVAILRRMQELARVAYILNDLRRNWLTIWATELLSRTVFRSPIVRNDAPHSCRAAFTLDELRGMAARAGLSNYCLSRHQGCFRMVLEGRK